MEAGGAFLDKTSAKKIELNRRELIIRDDLEDFFDEGYCSTNCYVIIVLDNFVLDLQYLWS